MSEQSKASRASGIETLNPLTVALRGGRLIEASAGTGKTFTIATLYVRLVLGLRNGVEQDHTGLLPPDILVVTFTEAASKELRERIRARLVEAAAVFHELDGGAAVASSASEQLRELRDAFYLSAEARLEARQRLLLASEWMDEAAISTIHGWCLRMLREHAFDSGSLFQLTLSADQDPLLQQVVFDYWRCHVYPLSASELGLFRAHWKTPEDLLAAVRRSMRSNLETQAREEGLGELLSELVAGIEAIQADHQRHPNAVPAMRDVLDSAGKAIHHASKASMQKALPVFMQWLAAPDVEGGLSELNKQTGFQNLTLENFSARYKGELELSPELDAFFQLRDKVEQLSSGIAACKQTLLEHAVAWVSERFEREKLARREIGFQDLLDQLDRALAGNNAQALANSIRQQFPVAMIDEFQDTDPVQYRIFSRIYGLGGGEAQPLAQDGCFLMIGDPKQAIYRFRGADIFTYLKARRDVGGAVSSLATNYRSTEAMVDAVNAVFGYADRQPAGAFLFNDGAGSSVPFLPVGASAKKHSLERGGDAVVPLQIWSLASTQATQKGKPKAINKSDAEKVLARACAEQAVRLFTDQHTGFVSTDGKPMQPVLPRDVAVLVNNRNEAKTIRQALSHKGIKSVYLSDRDSVLASRQAREVLSWIRAFAEPSRLDLIRAALASPSIPLSWRQLAQRFDDDTGMDRQIEQFTAYHEQWRVQGILPTIRQFLFDLEVAPHLLQSTEGERALTDILHLGEVLQEQSLTADGELSLVSRFAQMLRTAEDKNDLFARRLESDADLVRVVTIHKSKGLQYPIVFLPFATNARSGPPGKPDYVEYHQRGELKRVWRPSQEDLEQAAWENLGEEIRKLYVALTRAEFAVWVGVAEVRSWQDSALGHFLAQGEKSADFSEGIRKLVDACPHVQIVALPAETTDRYSPQRAERIGEARTSARQLGDDWAVASYSAISYLASTAGEPGELASADTREGQNALDEGEALLSHQADSHAVKNQHSFPRGAGPGTFLHDALEHGAKLGFDRLVQQPQPLQEWLARRCDARGWEEWSAPLSDWLLKIMQAEMPIGEGRRASLAQLSAIVPEMEFWLESHAVNVASLDAVVKQHVLANEPRPVAAPSTFNGMLKGFIDLVFEFEGRYYVLDYKSNHLGDDEDAYTHQAMTRAVCDKRYDLQYVIYTLALHRLLKSRLGESYDYEQHLGGAVYLFLRGCEADSRGVFFDRPSRELIERLDAMFAGASEVAA